LSAEALEIQKCRLTLVVKPEQKGEEGLPVSWQTVKDNLPLPTQPEVTVPYIVQ
jgi:hypothetical protein